MLQQNKLVNFILFLILHHFPMLFRFLFILIIFFRFYFFPVFFFLLPFDWWNMPYIINTTYIAVISTKTIQLKKKKSTTTQYINQPYYIIYTWNATKNNSTKIQLSDIHPLFHVFVRIETICAKIRKCVVYAI